MYKDKEQLEMQTEVQNIDKVNWKAFPCITEPGVWNQTYVSSNASLAFPYTIETSYNQFPYLKSKYKNTHLIRAGGEKLNESTSLKHLIRE